MSVHFANPVMSMARTPMYFGKDKPLPSLGTSEPAPTLDLTLKEGWNSLTDVLLTGSTLFTAWPLVFSQLPRISRQDRHPVVILPGFGGEDFLSPSLMGFVLRGLGHDVRFVGSPGTELEFAL